MRTPEAKGRNRLTQRKTCMSIGRMIGRPGEPNGRAANGRAGVMPDGGSGGPNPIGFADVLA